MRKRFSRIGVQISWQSVSPNQVRITAPIGNERDAVFAKEYISQGGVLEFRFVYPDNGQRLKAIDEGKEVIPSEYRIETYKQQVEGGKPIWERLLVKKKAALGGNHVSQADAGYGKEGWVVTVGFDTEGAKTFGQITEANVNHRLAIVLDSVIQSAPVIRTAIYGGNAVISGGRMDEPEARGLANVLDCPLPIQIKVIETKTF